jgi:hypothetical protein
MVDREVPYGIAAVLQATHRNRNSGENYLGGLPVVGGKKYRLPIGGGA